MLTTLNLWITRQRLANALRREAVARKRVATEQRRMAELEYKLERAEMAVLTGDFYRDAGI